MMSHFSVELKKKRKIENRFVITRGSSVQHTRRIIFFRCIAFSFVVYLEKEKKNHVSEPSIQIKFFFIQTYHWNSYVRLDIHR